MRRKNTETTTSKKDPQTAEDNPRERKLKLPDLDTMAKISYIAWGVTFGIWMLLAIASIIVNFAC